MFWALGVRDVLLLRWARARVHRLGPLREMLSGGSLTSQDTGPLPPMEQLPRYPIVLCHGVRNLSVLPYFGPSRPLPLPFALPPA